MKNQNFHIVVENLYNTICSVYPEFKTTTTKELFDKLMDEDFEFDASRMNNIDRFGKLCDDFLNYNHSDDEKLNLARCLYYAYLYQSNIVKNNVKCGMI